jgi:hypothetical protein
LSSDGHPFTIAYSQVALSYRLCYTAYAYIAAEHNIIKAKMTAIIVVKLAAALIVLDLALFIDNISATVGYL